MFQNFEIQSIKEESNRNRKQHENRLDRSRGIEQELGQPETFKRKSSFSPSHFDRSTKRLDWSRFKEQKF